MRQLLGDALFWVAAVSCFVAQVAIIRSTLRPHVLGPGSERVPRPRTGVEVAWVLLTAVVLIGVFALTWRAMHESRPAPRVQVSAAPSSPTRLP
ncbi:MAG TPA: hypothetical protein VMV51_13125 [Gemmatimonadaceae bacterium]|nr:hypothetical protein [Gemmatimonadaceae bacterium]